MEEVNSKTWIAFICMVCGMFMAVLDIQIVAASLKEIQAGLSATQDEINWIQSSYLIAEVIIIPLSGWLIRVFSTKIVFSVSCAVFTLTSLLCALSWDLQSMIIFRALQGFFGGAMIPSTFASIFLLFPAEKRPTVTVVIGLVVTVAPISGPIIGGYITEYFSWHYLFLLNIIPGILVTGSVLKFVDFDKPNLDLLKNIDFKGIVLIGLFLGSLQYVLEEGAREEWFDSNVISTIFAIAVLAGILMIYRQLTTEHPVINLYAFRDRNFTCGCIISFILGWGLFSPVFIMPVFLASVKGLNSLQIGEYLFVTGVFQFISAPCAKLVSQKTSLRNVLVIGFTLFGISCVMNSYITYESGFNEFFWPQALRGFSLMFCFLPMTSLAFATLPPHEVQTASGLYNLMRNLGGAVGLAITNTWLQSWTKRNYLQFREKLDQTHNIAMDTLQGLEQNLASNNYIDPAAGALDIINNIALREAYIITFNQVFVHIAFIFFVGLIFTRVIKNVETNKTNSDIGH